MEDHFRENGKRANGDGKSLKSLLQRGEIRSRMKTRRDMELKKGRTSFTCFKGEMLHNFVNGNLIVERESWSRRGERDLLRTRTSTCIYRTSTTMKHDIEVRG